MTAPHILTQWQDEAMDKIEAHAKSISEEQPEVVEALQRARTVTGPDELHTRVFRLQAIADVFEALDSGSATSGEAADPLEVKTVPELREIAKEEGVEGSVSQMNKGELIDEINAKREENGE
jgi:Rho termination factor, N-terminal domain